MHIYFKTASSPRFCDSDVKLQYLTDQETQLFCLIFGQEGKRPIEDKINVNESGFNLFSHGHRRRRGVSFRLSLTEGMRMMDKEQGEGRCKGKVGARGG